MDFKRLNNMTGKDAVLNRRITSIFINDYENFLQIFSELPNTSDLTELSFLIHKNSPSFMIFELESILATYTAFVERKIKGEEITKDNTEFQHLLEDSKLKIQSLKNFLVQLN
jgi:hypothetical protein